MPGADVGLGVGDDVSVSVAGPATTGWEGSTIIVAFVGVRQWCYAGTRISLVEKSERWKRGVGGYSYAIKTCKIAIQERRMRDMAVVSCDEVVQRCPDAGNVAHAATLG
jgi:hypothetical protein